MPRGGQKSLPGGRKIAQGEGKNFALFKYFFPTLANFSSTPLPVNQGRVAKLKYQKHIMDE